MSFIFKILPSSTKMINIFIAHLPILKMQYCFYRRPHGNKSTVIPVARNVCGPTLSLSFSSLPDPPHTCRYPLDTTARARFPGELPSTRSGDAGGHFPSRLAGGGVDAGCSPSEQWRRRFCCRLSPASYGLVASPMSCLPDVLLLWQQPSRSVAVRGPTPR